MVLGATAPIIARELAEAASRTGRELPVYHCGDLAEAVEKARTVAVSGDVVLLSPACASYDMFRNFEERGRLFKTIVNSLE